MSTQKNHSGLALNGSDKLNDEVTMTLTWRDILLLKLCLQLVDRNYTRGGTLRLDIQSLRDKLPAQPRAPDDSTTGIKNGNQIQKGSKERR